MNKEEVIEQKAWGINGTINIEDLRKIYRFYQFDRHSSYSVPKLLFEIKKLAKNNLEEVEGTTLSEILAYSKIEK